MASSAQQAIFAALRGGVSFKSQGSNRSRGAPPKKPKEGRAAAERGAAGSPDTPFHSHALGVEELNALRNARRIRVAGADAPSILPDLGALAAVPGCRQQLLDNIAELGWTSLTDTQMQSIPALLDDRDVLSCAPTGSGKTGAFGIPLLVRLLRSPARPGADCSPRAIILAPTRELATQIAREVARLAKDIGLVVRALAQEDSTSVFADCDVLVSTPLRLATLIGGQPGRRLAAVEILVLDEGDKLLEAGENTVFLQQVDTIIDACGPADDLATKLEKEKKAKKLDKKAQKKLAKAEAKLRAENRVQRCLFSATLPPQVEELARSFLIDPLRITVGQRNGAASTIKQRLKYVGREGGKLLAMRQLLMEGLRPPILVFVQSKDRAAELLEELRTRGWKADAIHAGLTQQARDRAMQRVRLGELWALVCTEVLARGIDLKHVQTVVNYDFPQTMVSYVHRIGRTGRAGRDGQAITFFTDDDKEQIRSVAQVMKDAGMPVEPWMLAAPKIGKKRRRELAKKPIRRKPIIDGRSERKRARVPKVTRQAGDDRDDG